MWAYIAALLIGFWLGVALFLYVSCYWLEEILDLPARSASSASSSHVSAGASGAHAQLKRLVARVVEEAAALPALARYAAAPPPNIDSSTYEDLLATAILNKVIVRYQSENGSGGRSSGIHSASASPTPSERSSPRSLHSHTHTREVNNTPPLQEEDDVSDWEEGATEDTLELPRRVPFPEFGGDIVHAENTDRDFDEVSGSDIQAVDGTWEENWLFQKKKIKTIQSVPVPMLVPNSNAEYRALIGDRDADDTTDLSDNASDTEEVNTDYKSDMKQVLDSKHIIGGKIKVEEEEEMLDFEPDSLTIMDGTDDFEKLDEIEYMENKNLIHAINNEINDNHKADVKENNNNVTEGSTDSILVLGIDSGPISKAEFSIKEEIHRTLMNGNTDTYTDEVDSRSTEELHKGLNGDYSVNKVSGSTNTLSRHEREGEYEETVTLPVQRYADSLRRQHFEEPQQIPTRDTDKGEELIPGSIADRERKKWLNYVEMPNNPYSPEAIQKRLSTKTNSSYFDMITSKNNKIDEDSTDTKQNISTKDQDTPVKDEAKKLSLNVNNKVDSIEVHGVRSKSASPRILKDVLAEEVPQYKRYGRDYYIKEAKTSSGGRKRGAFSDTSSISSMNKSTSLDNFETDLQTPGFLIKQFNHIATNQQYTTFAGKDEQPESITTVPKNNISKVMIEYEDVTESSLFSAKPAFADDETDKKIEEILEFAYGSSDLPPITIDVEPIASEPVKSPNNISVDDSYVSSSSLEDSIKIYNVQTGEIVLSIPVDNLSPRYETAPDTNANIDMADNNFAGETVDSNNQDDDISEETLVIVDNLEEVEESQLNSEVNDILSQLPKVKELAKKFVSMENINGPMKPSHYVIERKKSRENILNQEINDKPKQYMHSLTARSISREFREELKLSMSTPIKVPGGAKELPEGEEVVKESSRPGSPLPEPGTLKTKLAFFESLKSRFSK